MPTGYTAKVEAGEITTLQAYAERCAAAFLLCMRDANSYDLPDVVPRSKYYECRLAQCEAELSRLEGMTADQKEAACRSYNDEQRAALERRLAESVTAAQRYDAMRDLVTAWDVPAQFAELKSFMLSQLIEGRRVDVHDEESTRRFWSPKIMERDEWHDHALAEARSEVARCREEHQKEIQRAENQTRFIRDLRACFNRT